MILFESFGTTFTQKVQKYVVLHEDDTVLYRNSRFTSQLKTEEDSLRRERRRHTRVSLFYQGLTRAEHKGWWSFCDDRVFALFAPRTVFYSVGQKPSVAPSSTQLR